MTTTMLYLDPVGGIAGDMMCAALVDLGADIAAIRNGLAKLQVPDLAVRIEDCRRGAFAAKRFIVEDPQPDPAHRTWATIRSMITESGLDEGVRSRALSVFAALAEAEAQVHGCDIETVHFHEVGAVDSIADIVGACIALDQLGVSRLVAGPPPLSSGTIESAHGTMPLPAPATLALLEGWPVRTAPAGAECTTPTGAALLAALATPGPMPAMTIQRTGVGAGTRDPSDRANILRAVLGQADADASEAAVSVLCAQMDDLTGEHLPPLIEALLAAGAVDAFAQPVLMKKGRSGLLVTALAPMNAVESVTDAMLRNGSTFGVRRTMATRTILDRWHETVQTPWGQVRVKIGAMNGEVIHAAPEYADVHRLATASGQPAPVIHRDALYAWQQAHAEDSS